MKIMADLFCLIEEENDVATRQYIGARYVPKFADPVEWNNARSYEALEIVTYLNTSYTSKKPVPVGVAITNSEYWVATGNYNAQMQELMSDVNDLSSAVTGLGNRVNVLDNVNGKKIVIFGDSISDEAVNAPNWVAKLRTRVSSDTTIINHSINGAKIVNDGATAWIGNMVESATDLSGTDIFIIFAGTNDIRASSAVGYYQTGNQYFTTALNYAITKCNNAVGTAKIFVISPLKIYASTYPDSHDSAMVGDIYRRIMQTECLQTGSIYIDGYSAPLFDPRYRTYYCADGVHPLSTYSDILCDWILGHVNAEYGSPTIGRYSKVILPDSFAPTGVTYNNAAGSHLFSILDSGLIRISVNDASFTPVSGQHGGVVVNLPEYLYPVDELYAIGSGYIRSAGVNYSAFVYVDRNNRTIGIHAPGFTGDGATSVTATFTVEYLGIVSGYIATNF